jgi:hypothetical protein
MGLDLFQDRVPNFCCRLPSVCAHPDRGRLLCAIKRHCLILLQSDQPAALRSGPPQTGLTRRQLALVAPRSARAARAPVGTPLHCYQPPALVRGHLVLLNGSSNSSLLVLGIVDAADELRRRALDAIDGPGVGFRLLGCHAFRRGLARLG